MTIEVTCGQAKGTEAFSGSGLKGRQYNKGSTGKRRAAACRSLFTVCGTDERTGGSQGSGAAAPRVRAQHLRHAPCSQGRPTHVAESHTDCGTDPGLCAFGVGWVHAATMLYIVKFTDFFTDYIFCCIDHSRFSISTFQSVEVSCDRP